MTIKRMRENVIKKATYFLWWKNKQQTYPILEWRILTQFIHLDIKTTSKQINTIQTHKKHVFLCSKLLLLFLSKAWRNCVMSCCPKRAVTIQTAHTHTHWCVVVVCGCCPSYKGKGSHSWMPTAPNHHVFKCQRHSFIFNSFISPPFLTRGTKWPPNTSNNSIIVQPQIEKKTFLFPITPPQIFATRMWTNVSEMLLHEVHGSGRAFPQLCILQPTKGRKKKKNEVKIQAQQSKYLKVDVLIGRWQM